MGLGFKVRMKSGKVKSGEILIYEDIGDSWFGGVSAKFVADEIKKLGEIENLDVRINSAGGDVFAGHAIYSQLVNTRNKGVKVVTFIDGWAASIASVIAMAGEEIHIAEAGFIMIHDAWAFGMGNASDFRKLAETLDTVTGSIADVYVARTGQKAEVVRDWMTKETWFDSSDAVKNGFATKVVENMKVAASARITTGKLQFRNAPKVIDLPSNDAARVRLAAQSAKFIAARAK
jgi:ATP-dependent Clp protease protease subunit